MLYRIAANDVRTRTGSNVRKIFLNTGADPRSGQRRMFGNWRVHNANDTWSVPLLASLLQLRSESCEVNFDIEEEALDDSEINFMIEVVCNG